MRMLNSYIKGMLLFLFLIFPLAANAQNAQSDVDALKEQIEEMRRQNEEMIKNIQEQNAKQIQQLQKQINDLEIDSSQQTTVSQPDVVIDDETLSKKIEKSVNDNILLKTKNWLKVSYSPDFPTYYRTRVRFIENGTFASATGSKDEVFFIDSRFLLSPRIDVDKFLSVRAQFDIAKNVIWGGLGDQIIADKIYSSPSPGDSFRGAVLRDVVNTQVGN
jgi:type II secretory pathway pseudopilin PulG